MTQTDDNHFDEGDILDALEAFDSKWIKYPRAAISYRTGIEIKENKRNRRPQDLHLKIARATEDILYPDGSWRANSGRKSKAAEVLDWRARNPDGKKIQCYRDTGISRTTIDKYWNVSENETTEGGVVK